METTGAAVINDENTLLEPDVACCLLFLSSFKKSAD